VYAVFTCSDNVLNLVDPHFARVAGLKSAPRSKAHIVHGEDQSVKEGQVFIVEGAVNKDVSFKTGRDFIERSFQRVRVGGCWLTRIHMGVSQPLDVERESFFELPLDFRTTSVTASLIALSLLLAARSGNSTSRLRGGRGSGS
jgi:hypothetical protein